MMRTLLTIVMVTAACSAAHAQLVWEKTEVEVKARPADSAAVVAFPFTNKGSKPVTITAIKATCDCSSAEADKTLINPGESGKVTAKFEFGSRSGSERKTFRVITDNEASNADLTMAVEIPQTLSFAPQFVYWTAAETGTVKPVAFTVLIDEPVTITSVKSTNEKVKAEVKTLEPGKRYEVQLSVPAGTQPPLESMVTVTTDFPSAAPRSYQVFARVMNSRRSRTP